MNNHSILTREPGPGKRSKAKIGAFEKAANKRQRQNRFAKKSRKVNR